MNNLSLCKNCGHSKEDHEETKCKFNIVKYNRICPCRQYDEVKIMNPQELEEEYNEARKEYDPLLKSQKQGTTGYTGDEDFRIYVRQDYLWKLLHPQ